jgi:hypothetical protein
MAYILETSPIDELPAAVVATLEHTFPADNFPVGATLTEKVTLEQIVAKVIELVGNKNGSGSPVGVVTPFYNGQLYRDNDSLGLYQSTGLTNQDWIQWI